MKVKGWNASGSAPKRPGKSMFWRSMEPPAVVDRTRGGKAVAVEPAAEREGKSEKAKKGLGIGRGIGLGLGFSTSSRKPPWH